MVGILLRLHGPILTNYSILGQFPDFHHFSIFIQSDVIMQQWLHLYATSSSMSFHVIIFSISSFIPSHHYLCLSFDFHWVHSAIMSLVIPVITEFTMPSFPWLFLLSSLGLCLDATKIFIGVFTLLVFVFYYSLLLLECALILVSSSCFQCCFIYSLYNPTFSFIFVLYKTFK